MEKLEKYYNIKNNKNQLIHIVGKKMQDLYGYSNRMNQSRLMKRAMELDKFIKIIPSKTVVQLIVEQRNDKIFEKIVYESESQNQ